MTPNEMLKLVAADALAALPKTSVSREVYVYGKDRDVSRLFSPTPGVCDADAIRAQCLVCAATTLFLSLFSRVRDSYLAYASGQEPTDNIDWLNTRWGELKLHVSRSLPGRELAKIEAFFEGRRMPGWDLGQDAGRADYWNYVLPAVGKLGEMALFLSPKLVLRYALEKTVNGYGVFLPFSGDVELLRVKYAGLTPEEQDSVADDLTVPL
jgi:hypothetical protein